MPLPEKPQVKRPRHLPRLSREWYCGFAAVFWTHSLFDRRTGWLNDGFHTCFREILLHACARFAVACPVYCLMPDHFHILWLGTAVHSDQRNATAFLRKNLRPLLQPANLQDRAYDHVLRKSEREKDSLQDTCTYILDNPRRAGLAADARDWPYSGTMIAGYFGLNVHDAAWWETFWKCHNACVERQMKDRE